MSFIANFDGKPFCNQVQRGFAALQSEAPDLVDQLGIPHDPKEEKPDPMGDAETETAAEKDEASKDGIDEADSRSSSPSKSKSPTKKKRDPKEEMPLFLNQVTNLIAAAVPGMGRSC